MVMNIYFESMTKIIFHAEPWRVLNIRCWRQEDNYENENTDAKNKEEIEAALKGIENKTNKIDVANHLLKIERMNAVEVLDDKGNGPVVYKDWP